MIEHYFNYLLNILRFRLTSKKLNKMDKNMIF